MLQDLTLMHEQLYNTESKTTYFWSLNAVVVKRMRTGNHPEAMTIRILQILFG